MTGHLGQAENPTAGRHRGHQDTAEGQRATAGRSRRGAASSGDRGRPPPLLTGADRERHHEAECRDNDEPFQPAVAMIGINPEDDLDPVMSQESDG